MFVRCIKNGRFPDKGSVRCILLRSAAKSGVCEQVVCFLVFADFLFRAENVAVAEEKADEATLR